MKRLFAIIVALFLVFYTAVGCLPAAPPSTALTVHFIDVGQGDAILIDNGETEILIDGGSAGTGVADYLTAFVDGPLEVVIITHPHEDHIGGLPEVFTAYVIKDVWWSGKTSTSNIFKTLNNAISAEGAIVHEAERGMSIKAGALTFNVLNPTKPLPSDINNGSVVVTLTYGQIDFIFTGDAEQEAESDMLMWLSDMDILKVGHHGSNTASSPAFLQIIKPEIAVYMAGAGNSYGHPHQETITALNNIGATIYGTDTCGTIIITTDGKTYTIQTAK
jgi:competence protein ComEC